MLSGGVLFGKQTRLDQSERSMHFPFTGAPRRHICQIWVSFSQHGVLFLTRPPIFFPGFCMLRKDWPDPVTCVCFGGGQKNLIISQQWKKKEPGLVRTEEVSTNRREFAFTLHPAFIESVPYLSHWSLFYLAQHYRFQDRTGQNWPSEQSHI